MIDDRNDGATAWVASMRVRQEGDLGQSDPDPYSDREDGHEIGHNIGQDRSAYAKYLLEFVRING